MSDVPQDKKITALEMARKFGAPADLVARAAQEEGIDPTSLGLTAPTATPAPTPRNVAADGQTYFGDGLNKAQVLKGLEALAPFRSIEDIRAAADSYGVALTPEIIAKATKGGATYPLQYGTHAQGMETGELSALDRASRQAFATTGASHQTAQAILSSLLDAKQAWADVDLENEHAVEMRKQDMRSQVLRMSNSAELLRVQGVGIEALKASAPEWADNFIKSNAHLTLPAMVAVANLGREIEAKRKK